MNFGYIAEKNYSAFSKACLYDGWGLFSGKGKPVSMPFWCWVDLSTLWSLGGTLLRSSIQKHSLAVSSLHKFHTTKTFLLCIFLSSSEAHSYIYKYRIFRKNYTVFLIKVTLRVGTNFHSLSVFLDVCLLIYSCTLLHPLGVL